MLKQLERPPVGNPQFYQPDKIDNIFQAVKFQDGKSPSQYREVLDGNEIPTTTAHRWQQLAEMPDSQNTLKKKTPE